MKPTQHKRSVAWMFVVPLFLGMVNALAQEQATLKGVVIDNETRRPIPLVNIYVRGTNRGTTTNEDGRFTLAISGGKKQVVAFSYLGYRKEAFDVELSAGEEFNAEIELAPEAVLMNEVTVIAPTPYNERTASFVITEKQIEGYSAYNIYDVLRRYTPQIYHSYSALANLRRQSGFTLYVDSFRWDPTFVEAIDPYTIKKILVWRHGWAPMWFKMDYGSHYLVQVITR